MSDTENLTPETYTREEMEIVEKHIQEHFGNFESVMHEIFSPDIHVDICMIPPEKDRDYYTLVTMGMGAHKMNVPEELAEYKLERAELLIAVPSDWKINEGDEKWYWPIRLLKILARLPIEEDSWLAWGHTVDHTEPYAENTALCGSMLISPETGTEGGDLLVMPNGEEINFYQVIPLYREEMDYKLEHDADELLKIMEGIVSLVVDPDRPNAAIDPDEELDLDSFTMDDAAYHVTSIWEKDLPVDEINAFNHMAIYLRWCIENGLTSEFFNDKYKNIIKQIKRNKKTPDQMPDLRLLFQNEEELDGRLMLFYFNDEGMDFADWYYGDGEDNSHYYPHDVDSYAEKYFGTEHYNSEEFQDEAYLFVPWDEDYYQGMAEIINYKYNQWKKEYGE